MEDLDSHFEEHRRFLQTTAPFVMLIDGSRVKKTTAAVRRRYADFIKETAEKKARLCKAGAYCFPNPVVRGALTAILWIIQRVPYPYKIFADREEAIAWLELQAEKHSL